MNTGELILIATQEKEKERPSDLANVRASWHKVYQVSRCWWGEREKNVNLTQVKHENTWWEVSESV